MKVKELIEELQKMNPEALVVMSCDAEGNGYRPAEDVVPCKYHHGEVLANEEKNRGDVAVVFYPR